MNTIERAPSTPAPPAALGTGTRLAEFEIRRVIGSGGFGIVYLAHDTVLQREVAIKEYLPASLAGRQGSLHVSLRSASDAAPFALGLRSFANEARLLARFDHPSLVKVHRYWEAHGTAYMAMPAYRGQTLKSLRRGLPSTPDEAWMRGLLEPLLCALEQLHDQGVLHRDVAPDNILLEPDGRPVLLDFGAARRVIEQDRGRGLTAILKPAYAPIEQYAESGTVRQGPWTDLYALGATVHFMLRGRPPSPATARAVHDDMQPLRAQAPRGFSADFLAAVDWMIAPRPADRPASVADLRAALGLARSSARVSRPMTVAAAAPDDRDQIVTQHSPARATSPRAPWAGQIAARHRLPAMAAAFGAALLASTLTLAGTLWSFAGGGSPMDRRGPARASLPDCAGPAATPCAAVSARSAARSVVSVLHS